MSAAHCVHYLNGGYFSVYHIIKFELASMPKMLKNLSILIGYCDSHNDSS